MIAHHFVLRVTRYGPLVPARLWWCDHEPGEPENRLDRGRLSLFPRSDIAGVEVEPEHLFDRLMSPRDWRPAHPPSHWRFCKAITQQEYAWRLAHLRWSETNQPNHPALRPRRRVSAIDMEIPNFDREKELLD